jgi:hypothetical protein
MISRFKSEIVSLVLGGLNTRVPNTKCEHIFKILNIGCHLRCHLDFQKKKKHWFNIRCVNAPLEGLVPLSQVTHGFYKSQELL